MLKLLFGRKNDDNNNRHAASFDSIVPTATQSARDDRKEMGFSEAYLFIELLVAEVEVAVVRYECDCEEKEAEEKRNAPKGRPDYSWLMTNQVVKHRKHLTYQEKNRVENACYRLKPCEWPATIERWKLKIEHPESREDIIDQFIHATHDTIHSRKHEPSISEIIKNYASGKTSSMRSVGSTSPDIPNTMHRSVTELSFIELQEIV